MELDGTHQLFVYVKMYALVCLYINLQIVQAHKNLVLYQCVCLCG